MIDGHELASFIADAVASGWPDNTVPRTDADFPGFYGGSFERADWRYLDLWTGASTDAGMMSVFNRNSAVWICTYRGGILPTTSHLNNTTIGENELFRFLIEALRAELGPDPRLRGPNRYGSQDGRWRYIFDMVGSLDCFWATEQIYENGVLSYERLLIGGRVGDGVPYGPGSLLDTGRTSI